MADQVNGKRRQTAPRGLFRVRRQARLRCAALAAAWLFACACPTAATERLRVVTTTTDLKSLTEAVGGDRVEAINLVPPNLDAEEYQAKPQDAVRLKDARMVVRVGLDFDLWFDRLLTQTALMQPNLGTLRRGGPGHVDASQAIAVLDQRGIGVGPSDGHAHGSGNPHYWLDPRNAEIITGNILDTLARLDPANASYYEANRLAFLARLDTRLKEWEGRLASLQGRPMVAYHNSWAYLARRFRLNFIDLIEPKPGVPPSPARLASLIRTMRERDVRIVVRQPHEPERDAAFLAEKTGAAVVLLAGSVGALPAATDYLSLFDANVDALLAAPKR
ncbi:MAG TPA: metal ABC transporter substrate-binding protein [Xanthobacteraceae bacterium]|nr:metal ABC transporter substrate-binding protein [Xanthobacteraceae bacterium]